MTSGTSVNFSVTCSTCAHSSTCAAAKPLSFRPDLDAETQECDITTHRRNVRYAMLMRSYRETVGSAYTHLHFLKHIVAEVYRFHHSSCTTGETKVFHSFRSFLKLLLHHAIHLMSTHNGFVDNYPKCVALLNYFRLYRPDMPERAHLIVQECDSPGQFREYLKRKGMTSFFIVAGRRERQPKQHKTNENKRCN